MNLNEVRSLEKLMLSIQDRLNKAAQKYQGKQVQLEYVQQLIHASTNLNIQLADVKQKCDFTIYQVEAWVNRFKEANPNHAAIPFHFVFATATTFKIAVPVRILSNQTRTAHDFLYSRDNLLRSQTVRNDLIERYNQFKPHLSFSSLDRSWTRYPYNGQNNENYFIEVNFKISNKIIEDLDGVMDGFMTQFAEFIEQHKVV